MQLTVGDAFRRTQEWQIWRSARKSIRCIRLSIRLLWTIYANVETIDQKQTISGLVESKTVHYICTNVHYRQLGQHFERFGGVKTEL